MKFLITSAILLFSISISVQCQDERPITRGRVTLGGNFYGNYSWYNSESKISITASLNIGYFVIDNCVLGFTMPIEYIKKDVIDYLFIGFGPYGKYYFNNGLFTALQVSGFFSKSNTGSELKTICISPGFGYAYFIAKNISLETSLNYEYNKFIDKQFGNDMFNAIQLNVGIYIFL